MKTMKHFLTTLSIVLGLVLPLNIYAQGHHSFALKDSTRNYVRLLFAGDAMQHSVQFKWAWDAKSRQYVTGNSDLFSVREYTDNLATLRIFYWKAKTKIQEGI